MTKNTKIQVVTQQMSSPITYYGGKQKMLRHILPLIPPHRIYIEPFAGGWAVFFEKEESHVEIISDTNRFVTNFYKQAQTNFPALQAQVQECLQSRIAYDDAMVIYKNPDHPCFTDLDKAWAFWVATNMGFASGIGTWGYGTSDNKRELSLATKREKFTDIIMKRLQRTQIENRDALHVIKMRDRDESFFYIDPPYFNSNMGHYGGYTEQDFRDLLERLSTIKWKFLLSSYPSDVLTEFTKKHGWHTKSVEAIIAASKYKKTKVEVLTANYPI